MAVVDYNIGITYFVLSLMKLIYDFSTLCFICTLHSSVGISGRYMVLLCVIFINDIILYLSIYTWFLSLSCFYLVLSFYDLSIEVLNSGVGLLFSVAGSHTGPDIEYF